MENNYFYFKSGVNIYRIPRDEYSKELIDINLIENLVWKSEEEYEFKRNELSYLFGENTEVKLIQKYNSLSELLPIKEQKTRTVLNQEELESAIRFLWLREHLDSAIKIPYDSYVYASRWSTKPGYIKVNSIKQTSKKSVIEQKKLVATK